MSKSKFIEGIEKTGFLLENEILRELKQNRWQVINNRYYEDDLQESPREIDILAYKASIVENITIYTTIIISCKKNDSNIWALISKNFEDNNPNMDFWPNTIWSNDRIINYLRNNPDFDKSYYDYHNNSPHNLFHLPKVEVYAYQELNKVNGKPQNDKHIFQSLTSLMKAQSYEINSLKNRKKEKSIYQFNLVSLIDSELYNFNVDDKGKISEEKIDSEQILTSYIIKRQDSTFRIRLTTAKYFPVLIESYNNLHTSNIRFYLNRLDLFYKDCVLDYSKLELFKDDIRSSLHWKIWDALSGSLDSKKYEESFDFYYDIDESRLEIFIDLDDEDIGYLNSDEELYSQTSELLKTYFRYNGIYIFTNVDNGLPF